MNRTVERPRNTPPSESTPGIRHAGFLALGVAVSLVFIVVWSSLLSRQQQLRDNEIGTYNLAQTLAVHADALYKQADVVLTGVVERLEADGADPARLVRLGLLLKAQRMQLPQLHGLFVYDQHGRWLVNSNGPAPVNANNADRDYFAYHRDHGDKQAHTGPPIKSRSTGEWIIPVSRRIDHPDGSFAGVALATIQLSYLRDLYESIDVGKQGTINLVLLDGTVVVRSPFIDADLGTSLANSSFFAHFLKHRSGGAVTAVSTLDHVKRVAGYKMLDSYPLVVFVARDKYEILAEWRRQSAMLIGIMAVLLFLLGRQGLRLLRLMRQQLGVEQTLRRTQQHLVGANQALDLLARKDGLTGLANRREFDSSVQSELKRAVRNAQSMGVVMIDVDHFKQYNDHYGHLAGDECLRHVGRIIQDVVGRQGDVAARYGGEEFALVLPGVDMAGVFSVVEKIRNTVQAAGLVHAGSPIGIVTISTGSTAGVPSEKTQADEFITIADKALYAAKAAGRNNSVIEPPNF